jgi:tRNA pseudouridine38-40 synthase
MQPESVTVQQKLDEALSIVLNEKISTIGAGRTDAGVHAMIFCAHFDSIMSDLALTDQLVYRLNSFLPEDIAVKNILRVRSDANARYSAISRTYKYYISRVKDPFSYQSSWYLYGHIEVESMNKACEILFKHTDFTSFSKLHSGTKTNICRIYEASWDEAEERLIFTIKADRFLRNMVRAIVGTMVEIGLGKMAPDNITTIILAKDRSKAGKSVPAKGLFLTDIEYPEEIFT